MHFTGVNGMIALGCLMVSQSVTAQATALATDEEEAEVVIFFDEFSGPALDRSVWNVRVTGRTVNNEQQAYIDSEETLRIVHGEEAEGATDGALLIQPRWRPGFVTPEGNEFDFISGRIDTRGNMEFMYGSAAARIRLPRGSGLWPAFWALGTGRWPESGEIDIMEYVGEPPWTSAAVHGPGYSGDSGLADRFYYDEDTDATDWHVHSVDWSPEEIVFRVDGEIYYRVTRPMAEHWGPWVFDNHKYLILNFALGGAYPVKNNGVEEPYLGLPQETVERIQADEPRMLIDWVRVTGS